MQARCARNGQRIGFVISRTRLPIGNAAGGYVDSRPLSPRAAHLGKGKANVSCSYSRSSRLSYGARWVHASLGARAPELPIAWFASSLLPGHLQFAATRSR
jgi:hypothetical protein